MNYWLMKTEPDVFSFADLEAAGEIGSAWEGVRNYQARNFMRQMRLGDKVLIYHSSTKVPSIVGVAEILREAYPDLSQFRMNSGYFDAKASLEKPRWDSVAVRACFSLNRAISLHELRQEAPVQELLLLRRGNRLSVMPLAKHHFDHILAMAITI